MPRNTSSDQADLLIVDATVWTGVPGEQAREGWGVALRDGRIQAVGPTPELLNLRGPHTAVQQVEGRAVLPGFVDAHVHLLAGGLDLFRLELRGIRSPEDLAHRVSGRVQLTPPGGWILGGGWDEHAWGGPLPSREWLDRVAPGHPVFLLRTDLHVGVANSEALRRAGISADTGDPIRGRIDRGPDGREPTGILRETAIESVARVIPPPSPADREAALQAALRHALSLGVTQVHDMGALQSPEESRASLEGLRSLHRAGRLPIRVYAQLPLSERHALARWIEAEGRGDGRLRWGGVKGFVDGSLGASTAWFREPYAHDPGTSGGPISDLEALREGIFEAADLGLQPITHAIGDRAVEWLLEVYAELARKREARPEGSAGKAPPPSPPQGETDSRPDPHDRPEPAPLPRVEHAQHLSPRGLALAGRGLAHLSMQPAHLLDDGAWAEAHLGAERVGGAFAIRSLLEAGAPVAFGSDWTVSPMDPRLALDAAVNRIHRGGEAFGPAEAIDLEDALRAHTLQGALAGPWGASTGTLQPGRRGDLVIMEPSPFALDPRGLAAGTEVLMTYVGGALQWVRPETPVGSGST